MQDLTLDLLVDFAHDQQTVGIQLWSFHTVIFFTTIKETLLAHLGHVVVLAQILVAKSKSLQVVF
jgi:hypothetical protein